MSALPSEAIWVAPVFARVGPSGTVELSLDPPVVPGWRNTQIATQDADALRRVGQMIERLAPQSADLAYGLACEVLAGLQPCEIAHSSLRDRADGRPC